MEVAEADCSGGHIALNDVLALLGRLVDRSLVQVERRTGIVRYNLMEIARQYASERLRLNPA
jgi:predicted ATPase